MTVGKIKELGQQHSVPSATIEKLSELLMIKAGLTQGEKG